MKTLSIKQVKDHIQYFQSLVDQDTLSHAYLFTGDAYEDKLQVIREITQALIKEKHLSQTETDRFIEKVNTDQFADLLYIEPDGQTIRIDQMRQLKEWLSTSSMELDFKVAVIKSADKMNSASSNSLLKLLEEPHERIYLFLLTSEASALLPTIRSRVQSIHFFEASKSRQLKWLQKEYSLNETHGEVIVHFPTQMQRQLLDNYDEEVFEQFLKVFNYFYKLLFLKDYYGFIVVQTHLKDFFSKNGGSNGIEYLLLLNYSALMHILNVKETSSIQNYWISTWLDETTEKAQRCIQIHDHLLKVKERLNFNVSPALAYEQLVIRCLKD